MVNWIENKTYRKVTMKIKSFHPIHAAAKELMQELAFSPTFDTWKCAVILATLQDHWDTNRLSPKVFACIGDGHGFLSALIHRIIPDSRIYCIDLPKTLIFQVVTHQRADPVAKFSLLPAMAPSAVSFVLPQHVENIPDNIDCCINVASMQEMNPFSIESYFKFLRKRSTPSSRFYCVNREKKVLPDGEVCEFSNYPWHKKDRIFIDGPCEYYKHFISRITQPYGPRLLGVRIPFVNYFDGIHLHRLVNLHPSA